MTRPDAPSSGATWRILVVDDEPVVRLMLVRALSEAGYDVDSMPDGSVAWDAAREADPPYSLVVTDNAMLHMHGGQLARRLRSAFPDLPILRMSGSGAQADRFPEGVPIIYKPFGVTALLRQVRSMLEERGGAVGRSSSADASGSEAKR